MTFHPLTKPPFFVRYSLHYNDELVCLELWYRYFDMLWFLFIINIRDIFQALIFFKWLCHVGCELEPLNFVTPIDKVGCSIFFIELSENKNYA